jgi:hypothetical protein
MSGLQRYGSRNLQSCDYEVSKLVILEKSRSLLDATSGQPYVGALLKGFAYRLKALLDLTACLAAVLAGQ